jgi:FkbM family methyltransferase
VNVEHTTATAAAAVNPAETWSLATTSGLVFHVPPDMNSLTTFVLLEQERWFEPEMSLLPRLLQPAMNALDIGANHGMYALEIARCTRTGHVWAFEPTVAPRSSLLRSVQANGLSDRVTVVAAGLAECAGQASFAVGDSSELNCRSGAGQRRETVQLPAVPQPAAVWRHRRAPAPTRPAVPVLRGLGAQGPGQLAASRCSGFTAAAATVGRRDLRAAA